MNKLTITVLVANIITLFLILMWEEWFGPLQNSTLAAMILIQIAVGVIEITHVLNDIKQRLTPHNTIIR